jgi:hypothetical protein
MEYSTIGVPRPHVALVVVVALPIDARLHHYWSRAPLESVGGSGMLVYDTSLILFFYDGSVVS